jgi:hypothetical protein
MKQIRPSAAATVIRPADLLGRFVRLGLLFAIVIAAAAAIPARARISRECNGAFSRGFNAGFDVYHCDLVLRLAANGPALRVRLPAL